VVLKPVLAAWQRFATSAPFNWTSVVLKRRYPVPLGYCAYETFNWTSVVLKLTFSPRLSDVSSLTFNWTSVVLKLSRYIPDNDFYTSF